MDGSWEGLGRQLFRPTDPGATYNRRPLHPSRDRVKGGAGLPVTQPELRALCPGVVTAFTVLGLDQLGDELRDQLDPKAGSWLFELT